MSTSSTIKYNDVENSVQLQRHNLERNIDLASISRAIDFNEVGQSQVNERWALAKQCKSTTKRYTSTKKSAQWFKRFVINITAQINNKRKSIVLGSHEELVANSSCEQTNSEEFSIDNPLFVIAEMKEIIGMILVTQRASVHFVKLCYGYAPSKISKIYHCPHALILL
ncbi:unnamed protein product [Cuscuta campestris]|uniref:Uncharacterized protein n=1 Tax=Cuscuta campestris TaxID=132261 RepID=A0A484NRS2_9ASTE|nr:unnamed protein product [Cuscuta campestris]